MAVLDRSELEASPLADLHAIADQVGLEGFRRLRKADLIDMILGERGSAGGPAAGEESREDVEEAPAKPRRRRGGRLRRRAAEDDEPADEDGGDEPKGEALDAEEADQAEDADEREDADEVTDVEEAPSRGAARGSGRGSSRGGERNRERGGDGGADRGRERGAERGSDRGAERVAEGVVEVLGNGSAFLRVDPPEPSDEDVYISAAQVRRCELVSGDRVTGPVRKPRRSERYPSLVRIDTINGSAADEVSDGVRYDELPVAWPAERLALESGDQTLQAIEWLTPLGKGSRATIVGGRGSGKSDILRMIFEALHGREGLELAVVLAGVRPEEIAGWQEGPAGADGVASALSFAASADAQSQAVERALDTAKRVASRGGDAVVLIDSLDGLHPPAARRALAAARNLREGGSVTVIATARDALGGETTVIALDAALVAAGRRPILDLAASGTLRPELLVGEDGAAAIAKARAAALD